MFKICGFGLADKENDARLINTTAEPSVEEVW